MKQTKEPTIMVNGRTLNMPESRTVRSSLDSLQNELKVNGLGDDDHGKAMTQYYLRDIRNIKNLIYVGDDKITADPERAMISAVAHLDNAKIAMEAGDEGSAKSALDAAREALLKAVHIEF